MTIKHFYWCLNFLKMSPPRFPVTATPCGPALTLSTCSWGPVPPTQPPAAPDSRLMVISAACRAHPVPAAHTGPTQSPSRSLDEEVDSRRTARGRAWAPPPSAPRCLAWWPPFPQDSEDGTSTSLGREGGRAWCPQLGSETPSPCCGTGLYSEGHQVGGWLSLNEWLRRRLTAGQKGDRSRDWRPEATRPSCCHASEMGIRVHTVCHLHHVQGSRARGRGSRAGIRHRGLWSPPRSGQAPPSIPSESRLQRARP